MSILRTIALFVYLFGYMIVHYATLRREKGAPRRPAPVPEPPAAPAPPRAAELENPYGRYYGTARSREDLKR